MSRHTRGFIAALVLGSFLGCDYGSGSGALPTAPTGSGPIPGETTQNAPPPATTDEGLELTPLTPSGSPAAAAAGRD